MTDQSPLDQRPRPQPGIDDIVLYKGGESRLPGHAYVLKLSSNENPLGPPPSASAAVRNAAGDLHLYPSSDHAELRAAIGAVLGLAPTRIVCGVGSDEVLTMLCQAYTGPGDEVIHTRHGFSLYPILVKAAGATPACVDETDRVVDVDKILAGVNRRTKLVFVTNPGNPTATRLPDADLARLAEALPSHVVLVLDGAYAEYADGYDGGAALVDRHPNVVMTRTFSKLYGLGGLRIGYGYAAQETIDTLNRIRGPFNLSTAQLAAAEAAIRDRDWAERCLALNARMRDWLRTELIALGAEVDPSETNFVLARFASEAHAEAADAALRADGILVRRVAGYGFPEGLRITVGDEAGCRRVVAALKGALS